MYCVSLPYEYERGSVDLQMNLVARRQTQRGANLRGNHESALLTQHQRGIHVVIMPLVATMCHEVPHGDYGAR